jgi:hypothetical protein
MAAEDKSYTERASGKVWAYKEPRNRSCRRLWLDNTSAAGDRKQVEEELAHRSGPGEVHRQPEPTRRDPVLVQTHRLCHRTSLLL